MQKKSCRYLLLFEHNAWTWQTDHGTVSLIVYQRCRLKYNSIYSSRVFSLCHLLHLYNSLHRTITVKWHLQIFVKLMSHVSRWVNIVAGSDQTKLSHHHRIIILPAGLPWDLPASHHHRIIILPAGLPWDLPAFPVSQLTTLHTTNCRMSHL